MIVVVDIGNTQTVVGLYRGRDLIAHWRMATDRQKTPDEYGLSVKALFTDCGLSPGEVQAAVISSVVPPVTPVFDEMIRRYLGIQSMIVRPGIATGLDIRYENPHELGSDRIVNAVGGTSLYGVPLIIVDLGTAVKVEAISARKEYLGGAIAPGISISAEALFARTARLQRIELVKPPAAIGRNSVWCMQSGLIFGYAGLVDGLVRRISDEMGGRPRVVATGGLAPLVAGECETVSVVNPHLTLEGLRAIFELNGGD